jgi:DNA-binding NtrC family response regulator
MSAALRILYLDDNVTNVALVRNTLARDQMASVVSRVETEPEFRAALQNGGFDLILSDRTLPSFDGLSALRIARQQCPDVPFIFVSENLGEEVAIEALTIGATDYVLKSRLSRLVPSVRRALREAKERAELHRSEEALRRSEFYLAEGQRLAHTAHRSPLSRTQGLEVFYHVAITAAIRLVPSYQHIWNPTIAKGRRMNAARVCCFFA